MAEMSAAQTWLRTARFAAGRALIHAGLRLLPPGRVRSDLYALFDRWATHVHVAVRAHQPSVEAVRWANEVADEIEANPPEYLTPDEEAAFRRRLFGTTPDTNEDDPS